MWRALFLAIGTYLALLGAQAMAVEKVVLKWSGPPQVKSDLFGNRTLEKGPPRTMIPPPWVPWTLVTTGAVTCLYSLTIPRRTGK